MTRSSHEGKLQFDPEIEKTTRRLRKATNEVTGILTQQRNSSVPSPRINVALDLVFSSSSSDSELEDMANN